MSPKDIALMIGFFIAGLLGLAGVLLASLFLETCP